MTLSKSKLNFELLAQYCLIATAFFLPLATSGCSFFYSLALLFSLLSADVRLQIKQTISHPINITLFLYLLVYLCGISYSIGSTHDILVTVIKTSTLSGAILLFPLAKQEKIKHLALVTFCITMTLVLILSYIKFYTPLKIYFPQHYGFDDSSVFKDHIVQNYLMAFSIFILCYQFKQHAALRWLYIILMLLMIFNVLFMSEGRIGYFMLLFLLAYCFYYFAGWKGLIIAFLLCGILGTGAWLGSARFKSRMQLITQNLQSYHQGDVHSSLGERIESIKNATLLFKQRALFGHGTGSFTTAYTQLPERLRPAGISRGSYNNFLNIGVEVGLVGLVIVLYMFYTQWRYTFYLTPKLRFLSQGLIISMFIGCFANPWLSDFTELHFYALMLAVFFAPLNKGSYS